MIELQVTNLSKYWITILRAPNTCEWRYLKDDGTENKSESGFYYKPATPTEWLPHIVLRPKGHTKNKLTFSTTTVLKIPEVHDSATIYEFDISLSGVFPPINDYIGFGIRGRFDLETKAEQDGAGQPATAPESKPEDNERPKPESEGRSQ